MNKKEQQRENILVHGLRLKRIFNLEDISPLDLCKKLHRLETRIQRENEDDCSNEARQLTEEEQEKRDERRIKRLDKILNFRAQGIPVFINGDPRGYALKIHDSYMRETQCDLYRDWGGYGIIAPEF